MRKVMALSHDGEVALGAAAARLMEAREHSVMGQDTTRRGRHLSRSAAFHTSALIDLVAIAEGFTVRRLLSHNPAVDESKLSSWYKRRDAWEAHSPVRFSAFPNWEALLGFVAARNAIQHGSGRLTRQQLDKFRADVVRQLAAAQIDLNGAVVTITAADVERCHETVRALVLFIDSRLP